MLGIGIIAALCAVAALIIAEITSWMFFYTVAKICGVILVICVLIPCIKIVLNIFFDANL